MDVQRINWIQNSTIISIFVFGVLFLGHPCLLMHILSASKAWNAGCGSGLIQYVRSLRAARRMLSWSKSAYRSPSAISFSVFSDVPVCCRNWSARGDAGLTLTAFVIVRSFGSWLSTVEPSVGMGLAMSFFITLCPCSRPYYHEQYVTALYFLARHGCRSGKADVLCASCLELRVTFWPA